MVLGADQGRVGRKHFRGGLRVDETLQAAFAQGVEGDDGHIAATHVLQLMQHPRAIAADILAKEKQAIGVLEVCQGHGAYRHADAFLQPYRGTLVAHVGAVGQVVGAVGAREQLVHERGFQRRPPGGIEHHAVGVHGLELGADFTVGLFPGGFPVMISVGVVA